MTKKSVAPVDTNTPSPSSSGSPVPAPSSSTTEIQYKNAEYGFSIKLPPSWNGFLVIEDEWEGDGLDANGQVKTGSVTGPLISIRHPDWEYKAPRQDIPIMVFTIENWNRMVKGEFHVGAAPINPSELSRNTKYVFALPARYNFAFMTGYEEVEGIIQSKAFQTE